MPSSRVSSQPRDQTQFSSLLHWQEGSLPPAPPGKSYCEVNTKLKIELIKYVTRDPELSMFACKTMQIKYYYIIRPTAKTTMHPSDAVFTLQLPFCPINFLFGLYQRIWPLASLLFYPLSSKIAWKWPITIYQFWVANHLTPLKPSSSVTCCDLWSITHRLTATNLFSYTYSFINSLKNILLELSCNEFSKCFLLG